MLPSLLVTVLFSISAVCATRTARLMGGTEANFWRLTFAAMLLGAYAHLCGGGLAGIAFPMFFISGIVGFGIGDVALFQALPRLGSQLTVLIVNCLAAPIGAFVEWVWMDTRLTRWEAVAGATILAGVAVAIAPGGRLALNQRVFLPGIVAGVIASIGQALGAVLSRKAFEISRAAGEELAGLNAAFTAAYQRCLGGLILSGICLLIVKRHWIGRQAGLYQDGEPDVAPGVAAKWRGAWRWMLCNTLAGPTIGVGCYQWALKDAPTGVVLPIVALTPLTIIPISWWVEREKPSLRSIIGGVIAVAGVVGLAMARGK